MWFAIGWLLGGTHDAQRLGRPVSIMAVWILLPWIASMMALSQVHRPWAGYAAGFSTMAAMLAFASTPGPGRMRLALLEGLILWCTFAVLVSVMRLVFHMLGAGIVAGIIGEMKWIGIGLGAGALAGLARWRIDAAMEHEAT